jgi:hypothetical protein
VQGTDCPVLGCGARGLLKVHKLDHIRRLTWLRNVYLIHQVSSKDIATESLEVGPWLQTRSLIRFEPCSRMCVAGPTGGEQTWWVYRLLKLEDIYVKDPPQKMIYCYGVY